MVSFLQRIFGVSLWGEVRHHILPILWGPKGRNGKDTLLEAFSYTLGPLVGAVSANILLKAKQEQSEGPTPFLYDLRGKRMVWASETNEGAQLNPGQVQYVTGGGEIIARPCRGNAIHFKPTHTPYLLTNEKPRAKSDDSALWSRIFLIVFKLRFATEPIADNERQSDEGLPAKLRAEAPGMLAWLVRGCFLADDNGLKPPQDVKLATEEYRDTEDTVMAFVKECCEIGTPGTKIGATDLYNAYKEFIGETAVSQTVFGPNIASACGEEITKITEHGRKVYKGLSLKTDGAKSGDSGDSKLVNSYERKTKVESKHSFDKQLSPPSPLFADFKAAPPGAATVPASPINGAGGAV